MSLSTAVNSSSTLSPYALMAAISSSLAIFNSSTFRFDFSTAATIACKQSLYLLIRVIPPLDHIVSVLLLVIRSWVSLVSRSQLAASAIFFPLNFSLSSKFYHSVPSEVPLFCWEASKFHNKISQYHINLISITNSLGVLQKNLIPPNIAWHCFQAIAQTCCYIILPIN